MEPVPEQDPRFGDPAAPPTPWRDVRGVLEDAQLWWVTTVRRDGRPHVTPLTAVWQDERLCFCTGPGEQKAVNLRGNDRVALTTGTNTWKQGLDVVVEGRAVRVTDDDELRVLAGLWRSKYDGDWDYDAHGGQFHHAGGAADVFAVAPAKVLAFAKGQFAQTRYRF